MRYYSTAMQYTLIRSKNRRRSVSLQVSRSGELVVRAPFRMPKFFIDRFVSQHQDWVEKQKVERAKPKPLPVKHFSSRETLEKYIRMKTEHYAEITGLSPARLRFRQVKSYWGSCSPGGVISFNHNLMYAPPRAVDYVIVHELCHLKYRGHGKRFWDLVTRYYPQANDMRRVLRQLSHGDTDID